MKCYIGTKIVTAEPEPHADGRPGYRVVYPDGYASWSPKATFEDANREITPHERQLIEQTDAEHQVGAISDGEPDEADGECRRWIPGEYVLENDAVKCARCGTYENEHWHPPTKRCLDTPEKVDEWNRANPGDPMKLGDTVRLRR